MSPLPGVSEMWQRQPELIRCLNYDPVRFVCPPKALYDALGQYYAPTGFKEWLRYLVGGSNPPAATFLFCSWGLMSEKYLVVRSIGLLDRD